MKRTYSYVDGESKCHTHTHTHAHIHTHTHTHTHIYIYIYICMYSVCRLPYYLPNPSQRAECDTRSIFKRNTTDSKSEFSFS